MLKATLLPGLPFASCIALRRVQVGPFRQSLVPSPVSLTVKVLAGVVITIEGSDAPLRNTTRSLRASEFKRIGRTAVGPPVTSSATTAAGRELRLPDCGFCATIFSRLLAESTTSKSSLPLTETRAAISFKPEDAPPELRAESVVIVCRFHCARVEG